MSVSGTPREGGTFHCENNLLAGAGGSYGTPGSNLCFADVTEAGFVDPEAGDFHITATSPARNRGTPLQEVRTDMDGQERDGRPDVGADEGEVDQGADDLGRRPAGGDR
jgi:hypothetical protein